MFQNKLVDSHGRNIHKLRLHITDVCNFRCFYCMPADFDNYSQMDLLSSKEILRICSGLVELGIDEIRISGGEPTLRRDFEEIVKGLSGLNLRKLGLTTNAFLLKNKLLFLKQTKCEFVNVSMDSLNKDRFSFITKSDNFNEVFDAVLRAKEMGFNVKVNVVLLKGINDCEVFDFLDFSAKYNIEVRFLELMKIGPKYKENEKLFISAPEIIKRIEVKENLVLESVNSDSTSFNFKTGNGARIGFIASETKAFCNSCSRLRLTAYGNLRACLMSGSGVNLIGKDKSEFAQCLSEVMAMKPIERIEYVDEPMYKIGG